MQGRIIDFIKNIFKTIKNELKGPVIKDRSFNIEKSLILSKTVEGEVNIEQKDITSNINIVDLKDSTEPEIKELTLKKTCNNIVFFDNNIKVENNEINFKDIGVTISKKEIEKSKTGIKKMEIAAPKKECKIQKKELMKSKIVNGSEKIFRLPQKIRGRRADDFYKSEYEALIKKISIWALKNGKIDSKTLELEYVFERIPVQCIRNIKYDGATGLAELFFDEKNRGEKTMDFAIVLNKSTGTREKIFI